MSQKSVNEISNSLLEFLKASSFTSSLIMPSVSKNNIIYLNFTDKALISMFHDICNDEEYLGIEQFKLVIMDIYFLIYLILDY